MNNFFQNNCQHIVYLVVFVLLSHVLCLDALPVSGSALHLDASNGWSGSQWSDLSGNSHHAVQPDTNRLPTSDSHASSALNMLYFDGTDDLLAIPTAVNLMSAAQARTVMVIFETGADVETRQVLLDLGDANEGISLILEEGFLRVSAWSGPWFSTGKQAVSPERTFYAALVANSQTNTLEVRINGNLSARVEVSNFNGFAYASEGVGLGGLNGATKKDDGTALSGPAGFAGGVGEVIVYNRALTAAELASMRLALMDKWIYALPTGGSQLLGFANFVHTTESWGTIANVSVSAGLPFSTAKRMSMTTIPWQNGQADWRFRLTGKPQAAVSAGDVMLASLYVRVVSTDSPLQTGKVSIYIKHEDFSSQVAIDMPTAIESNGEWVRLVMPFISKHSSAADKLPFWIYFPQESMITSGQIIEVADVKLINYGSTLTIADLPTSFGSYGGRSADSLWRTQATQRIETHRKANLTISVVDQSGQPIEGATVKVRMKKHAFGFGSIVESPNEVAPEDFPEYEDLVTEMFSKITVPVWGFLWHRTQSSFKDNTVALMDWVTSLGKDVHVHTLIWEEQGNGVMQDEAFWAYNAGNNYGQDGVMEILGDHIADVLNHPSFVGKMQDIEVHNHPIRSQALRATGGSRTPLTVADTKQWYEQTRTEVGPHVKLYTNEAAIISPSYHRKAAYKSYIEDLLEINTPLDGVGFQSHFPRPDSIYQLQAHFNEIVTLGNTYGRNLELMITEFDLKNRLITDEHLYADFLRDFLTISFAQPEMASFILWHYRDVPYENEGLRAFLREDGTRKAGYYVWKDLVKNQWWTDATQATAANGSTTVRGFRGDYEITVSKNGYETKVVNNVSLVGALTTQVILTASGQTPYGGTAWPFPGLIQAENYDVGGEGISYHDANPANNGGRYRNDGVDIGNAADAGGGFYVGWTTNGEWLEYTIDSAGGSYILHFRISSPYTGKQINIYSEGHLLGTLEVPNTGAWQAYTTASLNIGQIGEGLQVIRLESIGGGYSFNWFEAEQVTLAEPPNLGTPYGGVAWPLPGKIQAENYDIDGPGVAYYDSSPGNFGARYRNDDVDIGSASDPGGGYYVGWVNNGEWLRYTVDASAGIYELSFRVASPYNDRQIKVFVDDIFVDSLNVPNTGAWQGYQTVNLPSQLVLGDGKYVVKLEAVGGAYSLNWFEFAFAQTPAQPVSTPYGGTARAIPGRVQAEDFDDGGQNVAYFDSSPGNFGGHYRPQSDVDIGSVADTGGGHYVGWINSGEWLQYSVQASPGQYLARFRVSTPNSGRQIKIFVDEVQVGTLDLPNTGAWQNYHTVTLPAQLVLSGGNHILRLESVNGAYSFNWFELVAAP